MITDGLKMFAAQYPSLRENAYRHNDITDLLVRDAVVCPVDQKVIGAPVSMRTETVHAQFIELLEGIRPNPGVERLFKEIVIKRWNEEYQVSVETATRVDTQLRALEQKKSKVIDLFITGELTVEEKAMKMAQIESDIAMARLAHAQQTRP